MLLGATACYSGLHGEAHEDGAATSAGSTSDAGSSGADEPSDSVGEDPGGEVTVAAPARIWRLSELQYRNTIKAIFYGRDFDPALPDPVQLDLAPLRVDIIEGRFSTLDTLALNEVELEQCMVAAEKISAALAGQLASTTCLGTADVESFPDCIVEILSSAGELAFRRPLESEELHRYQAIATSALSAASATEATAEALAALLISPHFLFRTEVGAPGEMEAAEVQLSNYERASLLSYSLLDRPPDTELWEAARTGTLSETDVWREQVRRAIAASADGAGTRFFRELLHYDRADDREKPSAPEDFDPVGLIGDTDRLIQRFLREDPPSFFETLLTTSTLAVRGRTAALYGVPSDGLNADDVVFVEAPSGQRYGLLTQPSFLVAFSQATHNDVIRRGLVIRESVLCRDIPDIPIEEVPPLPDLGEDATLREVLAAHSKGSCVGCHQFMDPIGFGLENYDHLGRFRTEEAGAPVDASGELLDGGAVSGPFDGPQELALKLSSSADVVIPCMISQMFRFWLGREPVPSSVDEWSLDNAVFVYFASDGDYQRTLETLFASDAFLLRSR